MLWKESVEDRLRFVHDARSQRFEATELCEGYGVSRKTG